MEPKTTARIILLLKKIRERRFDQIALFGVFGNQDELTKVKSLLKERQDHVGRVYPMGVKNQAWNAAHENHEEHVPSPGDHALKLCDGLQVPLRGALEKVVKDFGNELAVGVVELKSADRSWAVSKARTMIAYVLVRRQGYGLGEVAQYFARDAATVGTLIARLGERLEQDEKLRREIARLTRKVERKSLTPWLLTSAVSQRHPVSLSEPELARSFQLCVLVSFSRVVNARRPSAARWNDGARSKAVEQVSR